MLNCKGRVNKQKFVNAWSDNPDGFGCAFICKKSGKIKYWRTLDENKAYAGYCKAFDRSEGPMILHWRFATHGEGIKNVHPFKVSDDIAMAHNGVLDTFLYDEEMSDTANFANHILSHMPSRFIEFEHYQDFLEMACGSSNKLIFLQRDGFYHITNENQGHWQGGNWFSNHSYKNFTMPNQHCSYYSQTAFNSDDDLASYVGRGSQTQSPTGYPRLPAAITAPLRNKAGSVTTAEAVSGDDEDACEDPRSESALDRSIREAILEEIDVLDLSANSETSVLDAIEEVVDDVGNELNDDVPPMEGFGSGVAASMEIDGQLPCEIDGEFEEFYPCGFHEGDSIDAALSNVAP